MGCLCPLKKEKQYNYSNVLAFRVAYRTDTWIFDPSDIAYACLQGTSSRQFGAWKVILAHRQVPCPREDETLP